MSIKDSFKASKSMEKTGPWFGLSSEQRVGGKYVTMVHNSLNESVLIHQLKVLIFFLSFRRLGLGGQKRRQLALLKVLRSSEENKPRRLKNSLGLKTKIKSNLG